MKIKEITILFGKLPQDGDLVGYDNGNGEMLPVVCYRFGNKIEFSNRKYHYLPESQRYYQFEDFFNESFIRKEF